MSINKHQRSIEVVYLIFLILLSINLLFGIVFGTKQINELIYVKLEDNNLTIILNATDMPIYIPPSNGLNKLKIYDSAGNLKFVTKFDREVLIVLPYDTKTYSELRIYRRFFMIKNISLELCNHNNICESFEINCEDCNYNFTDFYFEKPKTGNRSYILLIIIAFFILILNFILKLTNQSIETTETTKSDSSYYNMIQNQNYYQNYNLNSYNPEQNQWYNQNGNN